MHAAAVAYFTPTPKESTLSSGIAITQNRGHGS
jgi:hypothetical protein